jgi:hypothetical protein
MINAGKKRGEEDVEGAFVFKDARKDLNKELYLI